MQIIQQLYGPFFNLDAWRDVLTSGADWAIIFSLILMECLLSVDNAVVLAAQTQSLPTLRQREKALIYGLWGSYLLRFLMIGLGTFLIHIWEVKVIGALYLAYLVFHFFYQRYHKSRQQTDEKPKGTAKFGQVVWQIVFMDAIFSVDSVLAALAVSTKPIIVLIGGLIGILMMRGVAEVIMALMQKIPELEPMAYYLIAIIAVKLFLTIPQIDIEIPASLFVLILIAAIGITLAIHFYRAKKND
ncbi:TerC family protein [Loigolactobacillus bifermentans]|uniref:Uncharacterized protein n=1 Tax=Loigolactobacillus bifermentans DSM 20003 TaxID=1423726 RepID=A0A0R1H7D7_9LACO|nr:TerC family protein [Loigolactobacillus bifermentans]KRK39777.1 hypothetical protein FC07_GL002270 [Loigolactobacillus bifermentans DSM 20003]QGG60957.1 DUF475 domain-containing protein [Loigolactobacillus bifermentans]